MTHSIDALLEINEVAWAFYNSNPANAKKRNMAPKEILLLLQNLNRFEVRYLLIGGFAMAFYGSTRATGDIDLWIENTPSNMEKLRDALIATGLSEASALKKTTQLVAGFSMFNLLESDFKIDLMHNLMQFKESDFNECYERASMADYQGTPIKILEAKDLLKEKTKINRLKDLVDIDFLKRLLGL